MNNAKDNGYVLPLYICFPINGNTKEFFQVLKEAYELHLHLKPINGLYSDLNC